MMFALKKLDIEPPEIEATTFLRHYLVVQLCLPRVVGLLGYFLTDSYRHADHLEAKGFSFLRGSSVNEVVALRPLPSKEWLGLDPKQRHVPFHRGA